MVFSRKASRRRPGDVGVLCQDDPEGAIVLISGYPAIGTDQLGTSSQATPEQTVGLDEGFFCGSGLLGDPPNCAALSMPRQALWQAAVASFAFGSRERENTTIRKRDHGLGSGSVKEEEGVCSTTEGRNLVSSRRLFLLDCAISLSPSRRDRGYDHEGMLAISSSFSSQNSGRKNLSLPDALCLLWISTETGIAPKIRGPSQADVHAKLPHIWPIARNSFGWSRHGAMFRGQILDDKVDKIGRNETVQDGHGIDCRQGGLPELA
ncbi:hypothetical protein C8J56DRAFT_879785 [Mycena floridula]|nr:hypothetical protein C8J56DRAFT_879785 [Mycena floridula]